MSADDPERRDVPGTIDPDRAAILARRQRFIAIALSGLAAACTSNTPAKPTPCLDIKHEKPVKPPPPPPLETDTAAPMPCLSPVQPPEIKEAPPVADPKAEDPKADPKIDEARPTACLKIARPRDAK